jgi:hypothetical protein
MEKDVKKENLCELCCEIKETIITCPHKPCEYPICELCYVKIDDKCPACRKSIVEYKKTILEVEIEDRVEINNIVVSQGGTQAASFCGCIFLIIFMLLLPIIKIVEGVIYIFEEMVKFNNKYKNNKNYILVKYVIITVSLVLIVRLVGMLVLYVIMNEKGNGSIEVFLKELAVGILTVLIIIEFLIFNLIIYRIISNVCYFGDGLTRGDG